MACDTKNPKTWALVTYGAKTKQKRERGANGVRRVLGSDLDSRRLRWRRIEQLDLNAQRP